MDNSIRNFSARAWVVFVLSYEGCNAYATRASLYLARTRLPREIGFHRTWKVDRLCATCGTDSATKMNFRQMARRYINEPIHYDLLQSYTQ